MLPHYPKMTSKSITAFYNETGAIYFAADTLQRQMVDCFPSKRKRDTLVWSFKLSLVALVKVYHSDKVIILLLCHQGLFMVLQPYRSDQSHAWQSASFPVICQAGSSITCNLFINIHPPFWSRLSSAWDSWHVNLLYGLSLHLILVQCLIFSNVMPTHSYQL